MRIVCLCALVLASPDERKAQEDMLHWARLLEKDMHEILEELSF